MIVTNFPAAGRGGTTIEEGGTGADNRKNAAQNLLYLGINPIASAEEDTTEKWRQMGAGIAYFSENRITDQPFQFGFLINIVVSDTTNIAQIFLPLEAKIKTIYFRCGWNTNWHFQWTAQGTVPAADEPGSDSEIV